MEQVGHDEADDGIAEELEGLVVAAGRRGLLVGPAAVGEGAVEGVPFLLNGTVGFATISGVLFGYFIVTRANNLGRVIRRYALKARAC